MKSLWIETSKDNKDLEPLNENKHTEICVIGAGMFGLTTVYYLSKLNKNVIVLEKGKIGEKVSGNTTGKITSQHGLFYNHLRNDFGENFANKYLEANELAIKNIKKIIEENNIQCDYEIKNSYVYATTEDEVDEIKEEVKALNSIGKKDSFINKLDLPFQIKGAIEFKNQAQFHPMKYMQGLKDEIIKKNKIYEYTTVLDIKKDGDVYSIITDRGIVTSKYVVIASHYPIKNLSGLYFTKMYQSTSYVIAVKTDQKLPEHMYINAKEPFYSFRTAKYNGEKILLICGSDHKTGKPIENDYPYYELEILAKKLYSDAQVLFRWNTRDCISLDKIPYIGEFSVFMKDVYIGTGFKKWGMTLSNVSANIVSDKILGKENKYEDIFNSKRIKPIKNRWEVKNMVQSSVNNLVFDKFRIEPFGIDQIENDNGAIIEKDDELVGVYKDATGKIYAVRPVCSHLGCLLSWNNTDKTWDCPCHGSRFDYNGKNLYEPAIKGLDIITKI